MAPLVNPLSTYAFDLWPRLNSYHLTIQTSYYFILFLLFFFPSSPSFFSPSSSSSPSSFFPTSYSSFSSSLQLLFTLLVYFCKMIDLPIDLFVAIEANVTSYIFRLPKVNNFKYRISDESLMPTPFQNVFTIFDRVLHRPSLFPFIL